MIPNCFDGKLLVEKNAFFFVQLNFEFLEVTEVRRRGYRGTEVTENNKNGGSEVQRSTEDLRQKRRRRPI
jgi:hypothetical protein